MFGNSRQGEGTPTCAQPVPGVRPTAVLRQACQWRRRAHRGPLQSEHLSPKILPASAWAGRDSSTLEATVSRAGFRAAGSSLQAGTFEQNDMMNRHAGPGCP